jgi:hypothetical protein
MCDLCDGTTFCQLNVCSDCKSSIDNMEQNFNSLQQLKAEVAELVSEHSAYTVEYPHKDNYIDLIERLRRLSAV